MDMAEDIKTLIRTRHALVTISTTDEDYVTRMIRQSVRDMGRNLLEWSISEGMRTTVPAPGPLIPNTQTLCGALSYMLNADETNIYVLKDSLQFTADAATQRLLREVGMSFLRDNRTAFLVDASGRIPDAVRSLAVPYEIALPDTEEIYQLVRESFQKLTAYGDRKIYMTREQFDQFLGNLRGLTRMEIAQVVANAVLSDGRLHAQDVQRVLDHKRKRLSETGVLDFIPAPPEPINVAGMANLCEWLRRRQLAFTSQAQEFGLEPPRGILMLGVQGCGKSLMARYVAAQWGMPLLRMDVGSLYDKYVGETERHLRQAFQVASAMAPCVLWIDEIEKAFASAGAGASSDGGLSQRMFGQLLTWMQDRTSPVFLVATANDITALPPELMRKGRFDEIFFVDLPGAEAREAIFAIHLARRKRSPSDYDLAALAQASEGFSGSEIEQAVVSALYAAFADQEELTTRHLVDELRGTSPLSVVMAEKIENLRSWASSRCVSAG